MKILSFSTDIIDQNSSLRNRLGHELYIVEITNNMSFDDLITAQERCLLHTIFAEHVILS